MLVDTVGALPNLPRSFLGVPSANSSFYYLTLPALTWDLFQSTILGLLQPFVYRCRNLGMLACFSSQRVNHSHWQVRMYDSPVSLPWECNIGSSGIKLRLELCLKFHSIVILLFPHSRLLISKSLAHESSFQGLLPENLTIHHPSYESLGQESLL